ncbi:hypothetical protein SFRURICE_014606, partial [Spodoptera frugiperda]
ARQEDPVLLTGVEGGHRSSLSEARQEDLVLLTGVECDHRSSLSELSIPHYLVFYPQKARRLLKVSHARYKNKRF